MAKKIYLPEQFFDGEKFIAGKAILTEDKRVEEIISSGDIPDGTEVIKLDGLMLAPGYLDLQINGSYGKMFSLEPTVESLQAIAKYSLEGGATGFLATIPTITQDKMVEAVNAAHTYWWRGYKGLLGLHLEGPFISPVKKGAHQEQLIRKPEMKKLKDFIAWSDYAIRMVTLAPEQCDDEVIEYLKSQNIVVSAGHSNATYQQAMHGFSKGITTCTHLYNAMSPLSHHEPGLVGAIFDSNVYSGIIPDGIHVQAAAVRAANKIMKDRLFFVTDAITSVEDNEAYNYVFRGDRYETPEGILAGSCLTMGTAVQKGIQMGLTPEECLRKASFIPANVMKLDRDKGRIAPGFMIEWVILDQDFGVKGTIIK